MPVEFGKTAGDYGKHRAGFPPEFFRRVGAYGVGLAGQALLDLGTGTGTLARGFARQGCHVIGLDPAEAMLKEAAALDGEAGVKVDYRVGRAEETGLSATVTRGEMAAIPEEDGCLDCVIAWNVVYHATVEGILRTLRGVHGKLKPGGYFFGTFASTSHSSCDLSRREAKEGLAERLEADTYIRPHDTEGDKALVHHYTTEEELRGRLLAGFEVLSLEHLSSRGLVLARESL